MGYNYKQLQDHVENHPDWNLVKDDIWHLDHIYPIKAFVDYNIDDMSIINCLENLRPMIGSENCSKGDRYNTEEFETWLKTKNIII